MSKQVQYIFDDYFQDFEQGKKDQFELVEVISVNQQSPVDMYDFILQGKGADLNRILLTVSEGDVLSIKSSNAKKKIQTKDIKMVPKIIKKEHKPSSVPQHKSTQFYHQQVPQTRYSHHANISAESQLALINQVPPNDFNQPFQHISNPYRDQFAHLNHKRLLAHKPLTKKFSVQDKTVYCECKKICQKTRSCRCHRNGQPCGPDCFCINCPKKVRITKKRNSHSKNSPNQKPSSYQESFSNQFTLEPVSFNLKKNGNK